MCRNLEDGGYFEQTELMPIVECDDAGFDRNKSMLAQIAMLAPILSRVAKTNYSLGDSVKDLLSDAGFVDIVEHIDKIPWSPWPDPETDPKGHQIGRLSQQYYETGIQGWILKPLLDHFEVCQALCHPYTPLTFSSQVTREQVDEWCETAIAEMKSSNHHWYSYK